MKINSKILLFGEYLLLKGSMGLAIPLTKYYGKLILPNVDDELNHANLDSNAILKKLVIEISHHCELKYKANINQLLEDALCGLYFESNIPQNYGLGSSGAVVAAIYKNYLEPIKPIDYTDHESLKALKKELADIEAYFHGFSSGTDPLISYLNKAVLLNAPMHINRIEEPTDFRTILIDTKISSSTKSYIEIFNTKAKNSMHAIEELKRLNNECIVSLTQNNNNTLSLIKEFCKKEQDLLVEMFKYPPELKNIMLKYEDSFHVKLCGSGGGGFLLGFIEVNNYTKIIEALKKHQITYEDFKIASGDLLIV